MRITQRVHLLLDDFSFAVFKVQTVSFAPEVEAVFIRDAGSAAVCAKAYVEGSEDDYDVHGFTTIDPDDLLRAMKDATSYKERFMTFVKRFNIKPAAFTSPGCIPSVSDKAAATVNDGNDTLKRYRPGLQLFCVAGRDD